jgi:hypothetical protein
VTYDLHLIEQLARVYMDAALVELLREQALEQGPGSSPMKTTNEEKEHKDITVSRGVRAELRP